MIQTILGVVLFFIPFIILFNFQDRVKGFLYVFVSVIGVHILIALTTQLFHIFSYGLILSIHFIIALSCIVFFLYKKKYLNNIKFSWFVILVLIIVGFELCSVHYFYKGVVNEAKELNVASGDFYVYPHYSDEWVGVSFVDYSIREKSLPLTNPLWYDEPFSNGLVAFYSFISEVFLFLGLNPLINWSLFAILNGFLISFLIYFLLRVNNISNFSSTVAALSVPLIVNGTNLPGIWFFTPFIFALSVYIISLVCLSKKEFIFGLLASLICLLLYPPFFVFVFPTLLIYMLANKIKLYYLLSIVFSGVAIMALLSINIGYSNALNLAFSWLVRTNLNGGGIISFPFWLVLPMLLIPFMVFGLVMLIKKRSYVLFTPIVVGILFWVLLSFTKDAIIIDQSRAVVVASILFMILVGFGVESVMSFIRDYKLVNFIKIGLILAFMITAVFYPGPDTWSKLVLEIKKDNKILKYSPLPPITRYLYPDDLKFFGNLSGKRFISLPLKGLVIGVATHNYPLDSKDSTVTNKVLRYSTFMKDVCDQKTKSAKDQKIDYVYGDSFICPNFKKLGSSSEGLSLYKFSL